MSPYHVIIFSVFIVGSPTGTAVCLGLPGVPSGEHGREHPDYFTKGRTPLCHQGIQLETIQPQRFNLKAATTLEAASEVTEEVFNSASAGGPQPCPDMGGKGRRVVCCKGLFGGLVVMWTSKYVLYNNC